MSVLITGAGLVGSQIARLEVEAGRRPVVFDFAPRTDALGDFLDLDECVVVRGDVCSPLDLVNAVQGNGVRRIVHTAAIGGLTIGANAAPLTSTQVNVMGSANVLEIARILELDKVVLCSSSSLYLSLEGGEDEGRYGYEEAFPRPNNVYAANKQAAEDLGRAYHKTFGVDVVAVRFAAVFGPWRAGGGGMATTAVENWLRAAIAGDAAEVNIDGADWIYSKDAAQGAHKACWTDDPDDRLFNLGMGEKIDAAEIAATINDVAAVDRVVVSPTAITASKPAMNIDRAKAQLGFEVEFPMDKALRDYHGWLTATGS